MNRKIILTSFLTIFFILVLPSIHAIEFHEALEANNSKIFDGIQNIDITDMKQRIKNVDINGIGEKLKEEINVNSAKPKCIVFIISIFRLIIRIIGWIIDLIVGTIGGFIGLIVKIIGLIGRIIGFVFRLFSNTVGFIFSTIVKIIGFIFRTIVKIIGWIIDLIIPGRFNSYIQS